VDDGDGGAGIVGLLWLGQPAISPSDKSIRVNFKYIEGLPGISGKMGSSRNYSPDSGTAIM